jgi:hypothetical protein
MFTSNYVHATQEVEMADEKAITEIERALAAVTAAIETTNRHVLVAPLLEEAAEKLRSARRLEEAL